MPSNTRCLLVSLLVLTACDAPLPSTDAMGGSDAALDAASDPLDASTDAGIDAVTPCSDEDGDGAEAIGCGGDDCDDSDPTRYPGAVETCDAAGVDEDCDDTTFGARDADGDGHVDDACCNGAACGDDCDDARAGSYLGAGESCDTFDNDCDGAVDEGVLTTYHEDADEDGYGAPAGATSAACSAPPGFVEDATDCDDTTEHVNPATTELCANGVDDNCNGRVDESGPRAFYADADADGYGDPGMSITSTSCTPPPGHAGNSSDCNDGDASVHPGATDTCNGLDDNCSLSIAGGGIDRSEDRDFDGHAPVGHACSGGPFPEDDCNDMQPMVHGGAAELCNGLDDDCSSGGGTVVSEDADGDAHASLTAACAGGFPRDDCNDADAMVHPGAAERCDRIDQNCSSGGGTEIGEDADGDGHAPSAALCTGGSLPRDDCDDSRAAVHPGAVEICDRLDGDCSSGGGDAPAEDADRDGYAPVGAACTGGPLPPTDCDDTSDIRRPGAGLQPTAGLAPFNGALTGSVLAPTARATLRPRFVLRDSPLSANGCGPIQYEVQVDDSCTTPGFASCAFPSPELTAVSPTTTYVPTVDLPVSTARPVGRRYYWRARACDSGVCSVWSSVRYVDVGRTRSDFDGDGRGDLALVRRGTGAGTMSADAVVFDGTASGLAAAPSRTLTSTGWQAAYSLPRMMGTGDLNGDGFADIVAMETNATQFAILVFLGSATSVPTSPSARLVVGGSPDEARALIAGFDVDADGYGDVVASRGPSASSLYRGSATGLVAGSWAPGVGSPFGASDVAAGDFDGDGFADVAVASRIFRGGAGGLGSSSSVTLSPTGHLATGDFDGDGYCDCATSDASSSPGATVRLFSGSATGLPGTASQTLPTSLGMLGQHLILGDLNDDHRADLTLTTTNDVYVALGGAMLGPLSAPGFFGYGSGRVTMIDVQGDGFEDVVTDGGPSGGPQGIKVFFGRATGTIPPVPDQDLAGFPGYVLSFVSGTPAN